MRKIFILSLAILSLLVLSGTAMAKLEIASGDNAVIISQYGGPQGVTPVTEVVKVSTGTGTGATVGDVMVWDYSNAADGYHVARASANDSAGTQYYAGVMVTTTSKDSRYSYSAPTNGGPTVGYMAVRGLVRAKCDTSECTAGQRLSLNGSTLAASFSTYTAGSNGDNLSQDIGICLETANTDNPNRVWLK